MKKYFIEISSQKNRIKEVEALMLEVNKEFGLTDEQYGKAMIAITELVMNAIIHGNKEDPGKKVKVSVEFDTEEMKINIADEGSGFLICDLPDPTEMERLLETHGRGVYIAKAMVDKMDISQNKKGCVFTLLIKKK